MHTVSKLHGCAYQSVIKALMTYADQQSICLLFAGAVLQCLRLHRAELTAECRKEELKLNIIQSRDVRLQPTLHKQCSEEIAVFCPEVEPGNVPPPMTLSLALHTQVCPTHTPPRQKQGSDLCCLRTTISQTCSSVSFSIGLGSDADLCCLRIAMSQTC